jgi:nucleoid-associated protein YgaU
MGLFNRHDDAKEQADIARANEARRKLDEARKKQAQAAPPTTPGIPAAKASVPAASGGPASAARPAAQPAQADEVYTVVKGDNLSKIAKQHLGSANSWRKIYDANREVIGDDPDKIKPGQKLRIPRSSGAPGPKTA